MLFPQKIGIVINTKLHLACHLLSIYFWLLNSEPCSERAKKVLSGGIYDSYKNPLMMHFDLAETDQSSRIYSDWFKIVVFWNSELFCSKVEELKNVLNKNKKTDK